MTEIHEAKPVQPAAPARPDGKLSTAALAGAAGPFENGSAEDKREERGAEVKAGDAGETSGPLLAREESSDFQRRWDAIQASFVDEPRRAVEEADNLVATAMKRLAEVFASERENLEGQWDRGDQVSTEDLRVALRRYRAFFGRLLAI
jgi:hypothetical protein